MQTLGYRSFQTNILKQAIDWVEAADTWEQNRDKFKQEITEIDTVRHEDFASIFPELKGLLND